MHKEIAIKAAQAGKHVICEKPLSMCKEDGLEMCEAVEKAKVQHMINFVYRKYPSLVYVKELVQSGNLGQILHLNCSFEQDFYADPAIPYNWHFKRALSGGGALLTIASHMLDLARFLVGDFDEVAAQSETFIKERVCTDGQVDRVDVDDATSFLVKFKNQAMGIFHTSWLIRGRKHHLEFELAGTKGTVLFNSERMNEIQLAEVEKDRRKDGFKTILIGADHNYGQLFNLKTGMGIGAKEAFTIQLWDFINCVGKGVGASPDFFDGLEVVKYTEAIQEAAEQHKWVKI